MTPAFPPSSRVTRLRPARDLSDQPTAGLPVKVRRLMRSSSIRGAASFTVLGTTLNASEGQPAASTISASFRALTGGWLGERRCPFVRDQVERKVEWADPDDGTQRHPADLGLASLSPRQPIQRQHFSIDTLGFFGCNLKYEDCPIRFHARGPYRLAGLQCDRLSELIPACCNSRADLFQDL